MSYNCTLFSFIFEVKIVYEKKAWIYRSRSVLRTAYIDILGRNCQRFDYRNKIFCKAPPKRQF